ncbi:MAG TPA: SLOG family protein [Blastocatellia bacterium]|nr:SLOG family protein [Blastocatellia bacterium]
MLVLITGDRNWTNYESIYKRLKKLPKTAIIMHGCARGADILAQKAARKLKLKYKRYPAKWKLYGRAAGPIRNREMLDKNPDLVIAFHPNIKKSRGTKDCLNEAKRRKFEWEHIKK